MEQEDYIKKEIERISRILGKMLADLLGLKRQGIDISQSGTVKQTLINELSVDIETVLNLSNDELILYLQQEKQFSLQHIQYLADIFCILADNEKDNIKRKLIYNKSLFIYNFIENNETTFSIERHSKIIRLENLSDN